MQQFHRLYEAVAEMTVESFFKLQYPVFVIFSEYALKIAPDGVAPIADQAVDDEVCEIAQVIKCGQRQMSYSGQQF